jgi:hypothetical protein
MIYQANGSWKQAGVAILTSDKVDFKLILVKQDKEGHLIVIKEAIHQKEITIINLYAHNVSAPSFIKHSLKVFKAHIDSKTVVVEDVNTTLSPTDRSSRQKINKEILELKNTINQMDLADVYSCLLLHYSQQPSYGNSQDASLPMNGLRKCDIYTQWNFTQPQRRMKSCRSQVNGWNWRISS